MHSPLCHAYVYRIEWYLSVGYVAKSRASCCIWTVDKGLNWHLCLSTDFSKYSSRYRICGIFLVSVVLDNHSLVNNRPVARVSLFCIVWMYRMGIVSWYHKAPSHSLMITFLIPAKSLVYTDKHILKEGRSRSLLGSWAYLFIVKYAVNYYIILVLCFYYAFSSCKYALKVIEPTCRYEFIFSPPKCTLYPVW